jgi:hypothetical protein
VIRDCLGSPGRDQCEWEGRSDVTAAKAIELASQGFIRIDADADPPLQARLDLTTFKVKHLPEKCETMAAAALLAAPGLSTAAKIGLGLGAGAGILLGDSDDEPVSASRP